MMDAKRRQEQIEQYLKGTMPLEDRNTFEEQLQNDPSLAEALAFERAARSVITEAGRRRFTQKLDHYETLWEAQQEGGAAKRKTLSFTWVAIAASVLILLVVGGSLMLKNNPTDEDLFLVYFEAYPTQAPVRSIGMPMSKADKAYQKKEYDHAAMLYKENLEATDTVPIEYLNHFYLGVSLLAQDPPQLESALASFQAVRKTDNDYHQQARWYQALALLKLGREDEAKRLFNDLVASKRFKWEESKSILKALE